MKTWSWNAVLAVVAALVVGACAGYRGHLEWMRYKIRHFAPGGDVPAKLSGKLAGELGLSEEQREAVYAIMTRYGERFEAQRQANREAMDAIRVELEAELEANFTPEQVEGHRRLVERGRAQFEADKKARQALRE
ncbi:MAG: hypothetical protein IK066_09835 [Kiritimatiellae bacterium]|nr:hypothetical protein [Kiritimatiellia bacterium]